MSPTTYIIGDPHYYDVDYRFKILPYNEEIFIPIKDFEGFYKISDYGRVLSLPRKVYCNGIINVETKILKPQNTRGWSHVGLHDNGKYKIARIHRLVALHFIGNPSKGQQINHKDGIKDHNHVSNLEWCTAKENINHAIYHGLKIVLNGDSKPSSKLSTLKVHEIYKLLSDGKTRRFISEKMQVSEGAINNVVLEKEWKHVGLDFSKFRRVKSSEHKGVHYDSNLKRWRALKIIAGVRKHFGYFQTEKEAVDAYNHFTNNI